MNILAFFAHPDDETILAGGTLALLARTGCQVHYLCATRGEGGECGDPPVCRPAELGAAREAEMVCAVGALGGRSLTFLDYTDPAPSPTGELAGYTTDAVFLGGQVAASIRQFAIDAVITHGSNGEYGHPAHIITHIAARAAVSSFTEQVIGLYSVSPAFASHPRPRLANRDDPADWVLDIEPALPAKTRAALCHRSQHALFVRRSSQEAGRQLTVAEVLMRREGLHRVSPGGTGQRDALVERLSPWLVAAL